MRMSSSSLMATKMTTRSSQSNRQLPRVLLALCCFISLLATAHADICQCGPRCAGYEVVDLCARCCTSVMRRRSVPWQSYPAEQLEGTQKRSSSPVRSDAIDAQILASIVEETAATMADEQQKKSENREGEVKQPQMEFEEEQPQMKGVDRRLDLTAFETQRHELAKRFPRSSAQQQVMEWRRRIAAEAAAEAQEQAQQQRRKRAIEPSNFFGQEQAEP